MFKGYQDFRDQPMVPPTPTMQPLPQVQEQTPEDLQEFRDQSARMRAIQSGQIDFSRPRQEAPERVGPSLEQQLMDLESMQTFESDPVKKQQLMNKYNKVKKMLGK